MPKRNKSLAAKSLLSMLTYKRPHGSVVESEFVNRFIMSLPNPKDVDACGNVWLQVGDSPEILWSAHTDSVHRSDGIQEYELSVGYVFTSDALSNCLGADNAAGVWLLIEMIHAKVPGLYIFHRGEERGGIGSRFIAANLADNLKHLKAAIAFDRRDTCSIITHQRMKRCCSDDFGNALSERLGLNHKLDDGGSFTDTASYMGIIPECTNVSVGYYKEHTSQEHLDLVYLMALRDAVIQADLTNLPIKRDPLAPPELVKRAIVYNYPITKTPVKVNNYTPMSVVPKQLPQPVNPSELEAPSVWDDISADYDVVFTPDDNVWEDLGATCVICKTKMSWDTPRRLTKKGNVAHELCY